MKALKITLLVSFITLSYPRYSSASNNLSEIIERRKEYYQNLLEKNTSDQQVIEKKGESSSIDENIRKSVDKKMEDAFHDATKFEKKIDDIEENVSSENLSNDGSEEKTEKSEDSFDDEKEFLQKGEDNDASEILNKSKTKVRKKLKMNTGSNRVNKSSGEGDLKSGDIDFSYELINANNLTLNQDISVQKIDILDEDEDVIIQSIADGFSVMDEDSIVGLRPKINNSSEVDNKIIIKANTGDNEDSSSGSESVIYTGDVRGDILIANFVNSHINSENILFDIVNIRNEFSNDLLFDRILEEKEERGFQNFEGTADFENILDLENEVSYKLDTGSNIVIGDMGASNIRSGKIDLSHVEETFANINSIQNSLYFIVINNTKNWSGKIRNLDENLSVREYENSLILSNERIFPFSQEAQIEESSFLGMETKNSADVRNRLKVDITTGENVHSYGKKESSIETGDIDISTVLLNFVNINFIGRSFFVSIVNVFEEWSGDIVMSFGDSEKEEENVDTESLVSFMSSNTADLDIDLKGRLNSGKNNTYGDMESLSIDTGKIDTDMQAILTVNEDMVDGFNDRQKNSVYPDVQVDFILETGRNR